MSTTLGTRKGTSRGTTLRVPVAESAGPLWQHDGAASSRLRLHLGSYWVCPVSCGGGPPRQPAANPKGECICCPRLTLLEYPWGCTTGVGWQTTRECSVESASSAWVPSFVGVRSAHARADHGRCLGR